MDGSSINEIANANNLELKYLKTENKLLLDLLQEQTLSDYEMVLSRVMIDKQSPFLKSIIIK